MKSVVLTGIRKMELVEDPMPKIEHGDDVLLKAGSIGVCGSDVHYYTTGRIGSQVVKYPFRVGHEFSAVVAEVGKKVKRLKPGDRVAVEPAMSCGKCDQCKLDRRHTCRKLKFLGCPGQADGCLCEYIVMPAECCYPIRKSTTLEQAAVSEPLAIGVYGVKQSVPMKGARIGIFGAGPIGLSVLLPAKVAGVGRVYMTDKINSRLEIARKAGASWVGNPDKTDIVAEISKKEPLLLDAIFECCGEQDAMDQAVKLLKPGGKLMLFGIPAVPRVSFDIDFMRRKEICVQNVRRQNECVQPALDLIEKGKIKVDFMVTHRFSIEQTQKAFDMVAAYKDGVVKAMINL